MARGTATVVFGTVALLFTLPYLSGATTYVDLPGGFQAAQIKQPTTSKSTQPSNPTVSEPDQIFTASGKSTGEAGVSNGKPEVVQSPVTVQGFSASGRKMLGELHLYGNGVSAGDQTAGASAAAYGQGNLDGLKDSHIKPHGVESGATVEGQQYNTNTGVDPDCAYKEGPCVVAGRK